MRQSDAKPVKKTAGSAGCSGCGHAVPLRCLPFFYDFSDDRIDDGRPFDNRFEKFFQCLNPLSFTLSFPCYQRL